MRIKMLATALLTVVALAFASVAVTAQDDTQAGAPGKVVNLQVSATSDSVTVTWSAPDGGEVSHYRVNLKAVGAKRGTNKNVAAPQTTATFDGLAPDTEYLVRVRAINDAGKSARTAARVTTSDGVVSGGSGDQTDQECAPLYLPQADVVPRDAEQEHRERTHMEDWDAENDVKFDFSTTRPITTFYLLPENVSVPEGEPGIYYLTPEETCDAFDGRTAFIGGKYHLPEKRNADDEVVREAGWHGWIGGKLVPLEAVQYTAA